MTKATIKKVPTVQVIVHRDDKRTAPEIGKVFPFTAQEVEEIEAAHKGALRDPKNEDVADTGEGDTGTTDDRTDEQKQLDADAAESAKKQAAAAAKKAASKTDDDTGL